MEHELVSMQYLSINNRKMIHIFPKDMEKHTPDRFVFGILDQNVMNAEYAVQIHPPFCCSIIT